MAHGALQEERTKEQDEEITDTEKQFLKDLYSFMKERYMPIERIPNLGFKQIDLYVMFKTVRDLGGYQQVTAQQLWKQVYNTLGGNPRSTSAATCTRRHYEKLLLPYECHVRGISVNILPHHQPKNFHYVSYGKDEADCQIPAKRKMLSLPMYQNLHTLQPDRSGSAFSLQMHYPHYYQGGHIVLPAHVPIGSSMLTPHGTPAPQFSFSPYHPNPAERAGEPLEHLRYLAERYKSSTGLAEPLNLSVKAPRQETSINPASSFAPPSSNKSPRFLNKPSPLYSPYCPQVVKSDRSEKEDDEATSGDTVQDLSVSSSPTYSSVPMCRTNEGFATPSPNPSSPKTDFIIQPKEGGAKSPDVKEVSLSQILPGLPQDDGRGEMEIEIPLSVFNNWLKMCQSSGLRDKQLHMLQTPETHSEQTNASYTDDQPTNLSIHTNPRIWSSVNEDPKRLQGNLPTPVQTSSFQHMTQNPFTNSKPLPSGDILKYAASQDVYHFDQQDIINKPYNSKPPNYWDMYDRGAPIPMKVEQSFSISDSYKEDKSETHPSAVVMLNSKSTPLLHLTTEEVMKLKKIISSSS
ncbi:AT-rich interaction domain 6 [Antennarius striatus]|uniref:AT-rich interaction domain 6 n=1 Tax=Antennarius striatus TaxID=241820 RepID=UPI0035AF9F39